MRLRIISLPGDAWEAFSQVPQGTVNESPTETNRRLTLFLDIRGDKPSDSIVMDFAPTELSFTLTYLLLQTVFDVTLFANAELAPVPIPGALPLFASALGLGGFLGGKRKRKAAMA